MTCVHSHGQCVLFHLQTISSLFCLLMTEGIPARYTGSSPTSKEVRLQRQASSRQNEMREGKAHRSHSQGEVLCKGRAQNTPAGIKIRINPIAATLVPPGLVHGRGNGQVIQDVLAAPWQWQRRSKPLHGRVHMNHLSLPPSQMCLCRRLPLMQTRGLRAQGKLQAGSNGVSGLKSDWKRGRSSR